VADPSIEARYAALVGALEGAYCVIEVLFDGDGKPVDYRFLETSAQFVRHTGLEDAVGRTIRELAPAHEQHWFERYGRVARHGESLVFSDSALALGRYYDVQAFPIGDAPPFHVGVRFRDVTEREARKARARATAERAELAAAIADLGAFRYDVAARTIELDARMRRLWGEPDDRTELPLDEVMARIHAEDRERVRRAVRDALDPARPPEQRGHYAVDYRIVRPDGVERWLAVNGVTRFDGEGADATAIELHGTVLDITARMQAEEALRLSEARLRELDARKDEFLAMLAHELRNPLATIRTAIGLLGMAPGEFESDRVQGMLERQVDQMVRLIDDLMEVSRISRGAIQLSVLDLDLADVVREAVEGARPAASLEHHSVSLQLPDAPLPVRGDRVRLAQVLANLLGNAVRYTDPGGHIAIRAERDGDSAVVSVTDDGIGIPAAKMPGLFEMFTQGDRSDARSQGGLGLGLALARRIARMHDGDVVAESEGPGRGSRFTLRLPLVDAAAPAAAPASRGADAFPAGGRVLVVDDNVDAADSTAMVLRMYGAQTRVAYAGPAALATLEDWRPDIILLDLGMPGMDGLEVARRVRADVRWAGVRIVALSGWGQPQDLERTRDAGFDAHLVKPASAEELQDLLRTLGPPDGGSLAAA
jgi:signal transduction histidine kinase